MSTPSGGAAWHHCGDGTSTIVGEEWTDVVKTCSQRRYKPVIILYQLRSAQY